MKITEKDYRILEHIASCNRGMPVDVRHDGITQEDLLQLERMNLIRCVALLKFREDPAYPQGRSGYVLTHDGVAALEEKHRKVRNLAQEVADKEWEKHRMSIIRRAEKRDEWIRGVVLLLIGWILGCFTPVDAWALVKRLAALLK